MVTREQGQYSDLWSATVSDEGLQLLPEERIADFLLPPDRLDALIAAERERVELPRRPWWRRLLGRLR